MRWTVVVMVGDAALAVVISAAFYGIRRQGAGGKDQLAPDPGSPGMPLGPSPTASRKRGLVAEATRPREWIEKPGVAPAVLRT